AGATYHVTIASGAIQDTSGNPFAGIAAGGLDFTTAAAPSFAIAAADASKAEGNVGTTPFTFTVTRTNPSGDATIDWSVTNIGGAIQALAGFFVAPWPEPRPFPGTQPPKTLPIKAAGAPAVEPNETFSVTLSNAPAGSAISTPSAGGTIQNDDATLTPIYTI